MKMKVALVFVCAILFGEFARAQIVFLEDTVCETYATYSYDNLGESLGMTFGTGGNLFVTQRGTTALNYNNGAIYRITPDGEATRWIDGINGPRRIEWTGGTPYGENLYVVGSSPRDIYNISQNGVVRYFSSINTRPHTITLDRAGNHYGGLLYSASRGTDQVYSISPDGTVNKFSDFPGVIEGGPIDIAFGDAGYYDLMYIAVADSDVGGIYQIANNGVSQGVFSEATQWPNDLEFDPTGEYFDRQLYVIGDQNIWRIDSDGNEELFATGLAPKSVFTFGQDGAMYVAEYENDTVTITRVIPDPCTISLFGMGTLMFLLRRVKEQ